MARLDVTLSYSFDVEHEKAKKGIDINKVFARRNGGILQDYDTLWFYYLDKHVCKEAGIYEDYDN